MFMKIEKCIARGAIMDSVTWLVLAALIGIVLLRLRHAHRKARNNSDKGEEIQRRINELRKKRDEE
jgi:hypothetical protein